MSVKLEEYLESNRSKLDQELPDVDKIWNRIETKQNERKLRKARFIQWIAASVLIALMAGTLIRHELVMNRQLKSLAQINADLAQREKTYHHEIDEKWAVYTQLRGDDSPITPLLINELHRLDTIYQQGLTDISRNGYNQKAITILLDTYEKRLRIIEQLIYEKQKQTLYENRKKNVQL